MVPSRRLRDGAADRHLEGLGFSVFVFWNLEFWTCVWGLVFCAMTALSFLCVLGSAGEFWEVLEMRTMFLLCGV